MKDKKKKNTLQNVLSLIITYNFKKTNKKGKYIWHKKECLINQ